MCLPKWEADFLRESGVLEENTLPVLCWADFKLRSYIWCQVCNKYLLFTVAFSLSVKEREEWVHLQRSCICGREQQFPCAKWQNSLYPPRIPLTTWIENVPGQDQCLKQKSQVKTVKCGWKREASTNAQLLKLRSSFLTVLMGNFYNRDKNNSHNSVLGLLWRIGFVQKNM